MSKSYKFGLPVWSVFVFIFAAAGVWAASTVGTNLSTTGTFTVTNTSATAVQFQNAAGTTKFQFDTTNSRLGVVPGGNLDTTLEVGGAASISGAITLATGSFLPRADGTSAFTFQNAAGTTNVLTIDTSNTRLLIGKSGSAPLTTLEVGGTASVSGVITLGNGQIRPVANSTTAFRLQNAAGTASTFTVDTINNRVLIGKSTTPLTTLEVSGTASISNVNVGASFTAATNVVAGSNTASSSTIYAGEFVSTATTSVLFGGSSATLGTCLQLKNTTGGVVYARINGTSWAISTVKCHQ